MSDSEKSIQTFNSFDEMENDLLNYFASQTPEQLLRNLKGLVLASFGIKDENSLEDMPRIINLNPKHE